MAFHVPERYRLKGTSTVLDGNNGQFLVPFGLVKLRVQASDGEGWEHLSVSLPNRMPHFDEMMAVKRLFWDAEDVVVQYAPKESEYVNSHPYVLHWWACTIQGLMPRPHWLLVGFRKGETREEALRDFEKRGGILLEEEGE